MSINDTLYLNENYSVSPLGWVFGRVWNAQLAGMCSQCTEDALLLSSGFFFCSLDTCPPSDGHCLARSLVFPLSLLSRFSFCLCFLDDFSGVEPWVQFLFFLLKTTSASSVWGFIFLYNFLKMTNLLKMASAPSFLPECLWMCGSSSLPSLLFSNSAESSICFSRCDACWVIPSDCLPAPHSFSPQRHLTCSLTYWF